MDPGGQAGRVPAVQAGKVLEAIIPNPKLKLLDQVREVMRLKHYSIRTEQCYCDWIRRYVKFHRMRSREELLGGRGKVELFLSDLAVNGQVSGGEGTTRNPNPTSNIEHRNAQRPSTINHLRLLSLALSSVEEEREFTAVGS